MEKPQTLRPVDLAREHGLSAQAIRNYDETGVFPPTARSAAGYRRYTALHAQALRAFLALRPGHGYAAAVEIMRAVHRGDPDGVYRLIDAAHAEVASERATLGEVVAALDVLVSEGAAGRAGPSRAAPRGSSSGGSRLRPVARGSGSGWAASLGFPPLTSAPGLRMGAPLTVGELARRLRLHPATLRAWEAAGILHPARAHGHRTYDFAAVRDATIAQQLRRGGYPLRRVAQFLDSLRDAGGPEALRVFAEAWQERLIARSRALLAGAGQLDAYLAALPAVVRSSQ